MTNVLKSCKHKTYSDGLSFTIFFDKVYYLMKIFTAYPGAVKFLC